MIEKIAFLKAKENETIQQILNETESKISYLEVKYVIETSIKNVIKPGTIVFMVVTFSMFVVSDIISIFQKKINLKRKKKRVKKVIRHNVGENNSIIKLDLTKDTNDTKQMILRTEPKIVNVRSNKANDMRIQFAKKIKLVSK